MRILIVAGGGGHFTPALSVIEKLPSNDEVLIVGRKYTFEGEKTLSFEYQTAKKLNLAFETINTARLQRTFTRHTIPSIVKFPKGFIDSLKILKKFKPDVVLSFGGYTSVPVVLSASYLKIPIVIHEQTLGAGVANKFAAKFANKICISWESSRKYFPKEKVVLTGNPIRRATLKDQRSKFYNKDLPLIYITGGSAGAHGINILIEGILEKLLSRYFIIHQTGDAHEFGDYERIKEVVSKLAPDLKRRYMIRKFFEPDKAYEIIKEVDLIISRSGINTVTELLFFGKPAILIPLPFGQKNEQLSNAEFIKSQGLGEIFEQKNLDSIKLYEHIVEMLDNIHRYKDCGNNTRKLINHDAADKIIEVVKNAKN